MNLKPRFLIKSGYYILPGLSKALILTLKYLVKSANQICRAVHYIFAASHRRIIEIHCVRVFEAGVTWAFAINRHYIISQHTFWGKIIKILSKKEMVFCYQNCSDLL